jgi:hypothetical protein
MTICCIAWWSVWPGRYLPNHPGGLYGQVDSSPAIRWTAWPGRSLPSHQGLFGQVGPSPATRDCMVR